MSIHFSLVTVTASECETEFFSPYTPWSRDDLEENDDFLDFLSLLDEAQDVLVHVEDHIYGEGEVEAASEEELADIAACVAECRIAGELTPDELNTLKGYISGQSSDGWCEGFEQREINVPEGELYVHFWSPENWSIETEEERFGPKLAEGVPETGFSNNNPKTWEGPEMGGMSFE